MSSIPSRHSSSQLAASTPSPPEAKGVGGHDTKHGVAQLADGAHRRPSLPSTSVSDDVIIDIRENLQADPAPPEHIPVRDRPARALPPRPVLSSLRSGDQRLSSGWRPELMGTTGGIVIGAMFGGIAGGVIGTPPLVTAALSVGPVPTLALISRATAWFMDRYDAYEERRIAGLTDPTPQDQIARLVELANREELTAQGLAKALEDIREVHRRNPAEVTGQQLAIAVADLARRAVDFCNPRSPGLLTLCSTLKQWHAQGLISWPDFRAGALRLARHFEATPDYFLRADARRHLADRTLGALGLAQLAIAGRAHVLAREVEHAFGVRTSTENVLARQWFGEDDAYNALPIDRRLTYRSRTLGQDLYPDLAAAMVRAALAHDTGRADPKASARSALTALLHEGIALSTRLWVRDELTRIDGAQAARARCAVTPEALLASLCRTPATLRQTLLEPALALADTPMQRLQIVTTCLDLCDWPAGTREKGLLSPERVKQLADEVAAQPQGPSTEGRARSLAALTQVCQEATTEDVLRHVARALCSLPELQSGPHAEASATRMLPLYLAQACGNATILLSAEDVRRQDMRGDRKEAATVPIVQLPWLTEAEWDEIIATVPGPDREAAAPAGSIATQEAQLHAEAWRTRSEHKGLTLEEEEALAERVVRLHSAAAPRVGQTLATSLDK